LRHRPTELYGGEQQRALLADEPTGNLDSQTGTEIMNFIREFSESLAMTIIMITHERGLAECYARRMVFLGDGKLVGDQSHVASATGGQTRGGTI